MKKHITHLARRLYYARKRKKALAIAIIILFNCILTQICTQIWVYPNTYFGTANLSGATRQTVRNRIHALITAEYLLRVQNREYTYSYKDLGIVIDEDKAMADLYAPNRQSFPANVAGLVLSLFHTRRVNIPVVFTQDFYQFTEHTLFNFSEDADRVVFDELDKSLVYEENEEKYRIDDAYFEKLLRERIGNNAMPLYPKLTKVTNEKAVQVADIADRIKSIFLQPMTVYVDLGGSMRAFMLTEKELADIARVTWYDAQTDATVTLNSTTAMYTINEHIKKARIQAKGNVATEKVLTDLKDALTTRFNGHKTDAITIAYDKGANSDGYIAPKYIEVDISQQKMYLFRNGKNIKTYRVSTGLEYPTPVGKFTILNKAGLGYSNIYDSWMPWWMGFKYSDELHAYFGIHEVPYKLTQDNKKRQPSNAAFIGTPNTGGCVALGVGDASEVYRFADIGTVVVIYN